MATKIMLVDDSSICNLLMEKALTRLPIDIEVHDFVNPELAFSQLSALDPGVIFLDLNMPELDGWGFLERMKETNLANRVIVLTSSTSELERRRCAEFINVLAYLTKPLTQDMMKALLHTLETEILA